MNTAGPSLYELRESKGFKPEYVAQKVSELTDRRKPMHWSAICQIEARGTNKSDIIDALAEVYGVAEEVVKAASRKSRQSGRPDRVRRSPKNC